MSSKTDKPPFSFAQIMTEPLLQGMPGRGARFARKSSFVVRTLRRYFGRVPKRKKSDAAADVRTATLANTARMWHNAAHAFKSGRIESLIRYISGLRQAAEAHLAVERQRQAEIEVATLTRRAWRDVRPELGLRLRAIDEWLEMIDPERSPDTYYWMTTSLTPEARVWEHESLHLLAEEIRHIYRVVLSAKAKLKFLALYIDDLRWLADYGATATEPVSIPSNRSLKQRINKVEAHRARIDAALSQILKTPVGNRVRNEIMAIRKAARSKPAAARRG